MLEGFAIIAVVCVIGTLVMGLHLHRKENDRLFAANKKLTADRNICVDALKDIATGKFYYTVKRADQALKAIGMRPVVVSEHCPPDKMYFLNPNDWGIPGAPHKPTDYL